MPIYHLSVKAISRSDGRSAVACAAYRSGEKLLDEKYENLRTTQKKRALNLQIFMHQRIRILNC